jgi:POT family proton-dependent oligopeptide transporter
MQDPTSISTGPGGTGVSPDGITPGSPQTVTATPGIPGFVSPDGVRAQRTFLGHPVGLYVLFFTEMWERFSYYGMRALLILYMTNYFRWSQKDASTIYKVYTSFVYVTPIIGGFLADRYLGNRTAVIIGAVLMAIGHFLMAFEEFPIFLSALIFLILGNGMFKPNMSTQVGRLYPTNDGRRDGAYTIFYMGINLGAFLSPLVCGWLADNTMGGYHSGFTMAGIGMVIGLSIYLFGQPFIKEIDPNLVAAKPKIAAAKADVEPPLTEAQAEQTPSVLGSFSIALPILLGLGAVVLFALAPVLWWTKQLDQWDSIMVGIGGVCLALMGFICFEVHNGVRDRVLAILILGVFVMFFWAAFEQAGNVLNVWADKHTDRFLTTARPAVEGPTQAAPEAKKEGGTAPAPGRVGLLERFRTMFVLKPAPPARTTQTWGDWLLSSFNPVPTAWFQSINALAIFVIAPFFAWMWIALDRRNLQPSIPLKMFLGLVMMSASMAIMMGAAGQEDRATAVTIDSEKLPAGIVAVGPDHRVGVTDSAGNPEFVQAGRLRFDPATRTLHMTGVLSDLERDRIIEATAPADFKTKVEELKKNSATIDDNKPSVQIVLDKVPPGFDLAYSHLKASVVSFDSQARMLTAYQPLAEKEVKGLLAAAGDPTFRAKIYDLHSKSDIFVVSSWWLFWSYILATLGELCLSPVGLSMVSKLAPTRFATMLMGVWMLTSAFGNFAAGLAGEHWESMTPMQFFLLATAITGGASLVLLVLVRPVVKTMHGVN